MKESRYYCPPGLQRLSEPEAEEPLGSPFLRTTPMDRTYGEHHQPIRYTTPSDFEFEYMVSDYQGGTTPGKVPSYTLTAHFSEDE